MIDFATLLQMMVDQNSSDLFVTAGVAPSIKTHGTVKPACEEKLDAEQAREMCYAVMNERQRTQLENTFECQFAISARGIGRFRVSTFIQRGNVGMVVRKIETHIPTLEELQVPMVLREISMIKRGLALMVGGTGTGKSTTLAAMVGYRNNNSTGHIITIEDPIEYLHPHGGCIVTQREVGVDTLSFEEALKNTLRQAPDVILIGEIRARETMEHAIAFAETGHLCLATLHANNANQALDRIINFFPEDRRQQLFMDLSLNLKAIVSQRLLPTVDGKGRRAAVEVMLASPLITDLIGARDQADHGPLERAWHAHLRSGLACPVCRRRHHLRRGHRQRRFGQRFAPADQAGTRWRGGPDGAGFAEILTQARGQGRAGTAGVQPPAADGLPAGRRPEQLGNGGSRSAGMPCHDRWL